MSSRHITQTALRKAVDEYRAEHNDKLDKLEIWARELLDRLTHSDDAVKAFERLKLKDGRERDFIGLCILTAGLAHRFSRLVLEMPARLKRLERLGKAITDLRLFVEQLASRSDLLVPMLDPLPMWGPLLDPATPDDFAAVTAMMSGLELIAEAITKQRRIDETVLAKYGATRKKHHENAGNIVAIGYLAEGTRTLTGKPHKRELTTLAPVILGKINLSEDSVTYALRPQKERIRRG